MEGCEYDPKGASCWATAVACVGEGHVICEWGRLKLDCLRSRCALCLNTGSECVRSGAMQISTCHQHCVLCCDFDVICNPPPPLCWGGETINSDP